MKDVNKWDNPLNNERMDIDKLTELVVEGFSQCDALCESRSFDGCDRCICIRETFPTPRHYEIYLKLRETYVSMVDAAIVARHIKDCDDTTN